MTPTKFPGYLPKMFVTGVDDACPSLIHVVGKAHHGGAPAHWDPSLLPHVNLEVLAAQFSEKVGSTTPSRSSTDDGHSSTREDLWRAQDWEESTQKWNPAQQKPEDSTQHLYGLCRLQWWYMVTLVRID